MIIRTPTERAIYDAARRAELDAYSLRAGYEMLIDEANKKLAKAEADAKKAEAEVRQALEKAETDAKQAEAKGKREMLLRLLQSPRFAGLPADLRARIETQSDVEQLNRWFDAALLASSIEEFASKLNP